MDHIKRGNPEHGIFVELCMLNLQCKGFACEPSPDPLYDLLITKDGRRYQLVRVFAVKNLCSYEDPYMRSVAQSLPEECFFYSFCNIGGDTWIANMEGSNLYLDQSEFFYMPAPPEPYELPESSACGELDQTVLEMLRRSSNEPIRPLIEELDALIEELDMPIAEESDAPFFEGPDSLVPDEQEGADVIDIKLSEDPSKWVEEYLKERVKVELGSDCDVEPALDPQFDLFAIPSRESEYCKPFHIIIVPILSEEDFGAPINQVLRAISKIDPAYGDQCFMIYEYDVTTGDADSYFNDSEEMMHKLLSAGE